MSFSQVNESSPEDFATQKYFESISPLNKTAKFIYNVDTTRAFVIEGTPSPGDVLTYSSSAAGTWANPDKVNWVPVAAGGINSITAGTPGAATGASKLTITAPGPGVVGLALANTAVTPGVYGGAASVPQITVDQQGQLTSAVNVPVAFPDQLASIPVRSWKAGSGSATTTDSVAVGDLCQAADESVSMGSSASNFGQVQSVSIGHQVNLGGAGPRHVNIGYRAMGGILGDSVSIGHTASAPSRSVAVGPASGNPSSTGERNTYLGRGAVDKLNTDVDLVSIGHQASTGNESVAVGASTSALANSVVVGKSASTTVGTSCVSIGHTAVCNGNSAISIGASIQAGLQSTAVGGFANSTGSTSVGYLCNSAANNSTTVGYNCRITSVNGVAIGKDCGNIGVTGTGNLFIGHTVALGTLTTGTNCTLIGQNISVGNATDSSAIAIGRNITVVQDAISIGAVSAATGPGSVVIGASATSNFAAQDAVILGKSAVGTDCARGICIGPSAKLAATENVIIGFNAGNAANISTGSVIIGQNAGTATNAAFNTIIGNNASVSASRASCVVIGSVAASTQASCCVIGANSTCTATNANAIGFDVDNATANSTLIGSNKSVNHIVDSEGLFRSVNQVGCVATNAGQVIGPASTFALSTEESSYPAGLLDNPNDWIFLSAVGTEAAGRSYQLSWSMLTVAGASNNRWIITVFLNEPGIGGTPRQVGWSEICSGVANDCAVSGSVVVKINSAITGRPYFYLSAARVAGAANLTVTNFRQSFVRVN